MEGSRREFKDLLRHVVLSPSSDKAWFVDMYQDVFEPLKPVSSSKKDSSSSTSTPSTSSSSPSSTSPVVVKQDPAISDFRAVYRKAFRRASFGYLEPQLLDQLYIKATTDFKTALNADASAATHLSSQSSELEHSSSMRRAQAEMKWILQVNDWRRQRVGMSIKQDAVEKFRRQLWRKFHFDPFHIYHGGERPGQITEFCDRLMTEMEKEFREELPDFENEYGVADKLTSELRELMSKVVTEALEANTRNGEISEKVDRAGVSYKEMMTKFFEQDPFAKEDKVIESRASIKAKCEEGAGLEESLSNPSWRKFWDDKVGGMLEQLEAKRKLDGQTLIENLRGAMKEASQKFFQRWRKVRVDEDRLDGLFSENFPQALKDIIVTAVEITPEEEGSSTQPVVEGTPPASIPSTGLQLPIWIEYKDSQRHILFPKGTALPCEEEIINYVRSGTGNPSSGIAHLNLWEGAGLPNSWKHLLDYKVEMVKRDAAEIVNLTIRIDASGLLQVEEEIRDAENDAVDKRIILKVLTSGWTGGGAFEQGKNGGMDYCWTSRDTAEVEGGSSNSGQEEDERGASKRKKTSVASVSSNEANDSNVEADSPNRKRSRGRKSSLGNS